MVKRNLASDMAAEGRSGKRSRRTRGVSRAYIAKTTRQVVLRMAEKKCANTYINESVVNSTSRGSNFFALSNITQGSDHASRIGREIHLDSLMIRGVLHNNSSGTHLVRIVIGYQLDQAVPGSATEIFDSGSRGGPPVALDVLDVDGSAGLAAMNLTINKVKFQTIYDRIHKLGSSSADGYNVKTLAIRKKLNKKIKFEANTTGAANQDKQLYIGAWTAEGANDAAAPGTAVELSFLAALKYTDL